MLIINSPHNPTGRGRVFTRWQRVDGSTAGLSVGASALGKRKKAVSDATSYEQLE